MFLVKIYFAFGEKYKWNKSPSVGIYKLTLPMKEIVYNNVGFLIKPNTKLSNLQKKYQLVLKNEIKKKLSKDLGLLKNQKFIFDKNKNFFSLNIDDKYFEIFLSLS